MIGSILAGTTLLSCALNLWQWAAGRKFPVGKKRIPAAPLPAFSILKPLKGADAETEACLRSWFEQEYAANIELIFGVAEEHDPAADIIRRIAAEYPDRKSKLVICSPVLGPNAKVSTLCYLAAEAGHEHLVVSDADVEIFPDFLHQMAASFETGAHLVNCFYIMRPLNGPMAVEAVAVNADFWTQVLQGNMIKPMDFALGAVMGTTRTQLGRIGGFEGLLHHLADDYHLGNRIAKAGGQLAICPTPVTCWSEPQSWGQVWRHQLRWGRTIRVCQPVPYFFSILANGTVWPLLAILVAQSSETLGLAQIALLTRALTAMSNYSRLTGGPGWLAFGLAPVRDIMGAAVWAQSFLGSTVTWRGRQFHVNKSGKLTPLA